MVAQVQIGLRASRGGRLDANALAAVCGFHCDFLVVHLFFLSNSARSTMASARACASRQRTRMDRSVPIVAIVRFRLFALRMKFPTVCVDTSSL